MYDSRANRNGSGRLRNLPGILGSVVGIGLAAACLLSYATRRDRAPERPVVHAGRATLHNGWHLSPMGVQQKVGDMLLGGALSPDKKLLAVINAGFNAHHLYLLDACSGVIRQTLPLERAWNGVAWNPDGNTLYVSGGGLPRIHVFTRSADGAFAAVAPIALPGLTANPPEQKGPKPGKDAPQAYVSGLAVSPDGQTLFAANFATDTVFAIGLGEGGHGDIKATRKLDTLAHPYCLRLSPDGSELFVTEGALKRVEALRTDDLTTARVLPTEAHPNDLLFAPDGRLFVSCGSSDSVLVLDAKTGQQTERITVTLTPHAPAGATPNALSLAPDGKTLYVADADNNDVAVIDVAQAGRSRVRGFIPTGWYPTLVCATPDGKNLLIGSGKGMGAGPNATPNPQSKDAVESHYTYVGTLLYGMIATLAVPQDAALAGYTRQVMANTPYRDALINTPRTAPRPGSNPIPSRVGDPSPIKYVLYIIKENRTYDQVLGDIPGANGDPRLTLFGEKITPNIHALAREYVLLDNTYCNGDVSGNGHPWSTGAYGTDIGERAWMQAYGSHADWPLKDPDIYPPVGRIWDRCEQKGVSWASYYFTWTTDNTRQHMRAAWAAIYDKHREFERADVFIADLKRYEQHNNLPHFMIMSLPEDHTNGTSPGAFTPQACVASNDLGVGKIVAACSKSKFWPHMAIFVIQDDAQDGPDHVEAHRTESLVISPYTRHRGVDSTFYTTTSLLRSMELILGLAPMSEYDAAATPMYNAFLNKPDTTPYVCRPAQVNLMAKNTPKSYGAKQSSRMDFSKPDQLTAKQVDSLNRILWHSVKGTAAPYPAPVHRALLASSGQSVLGVHTDGDEEEKREEGWRKRRGLVTRIRHGNKSPF